MGKLVLGSSKHNVPRATDSVVILQRQQGANSSGVGSGFAYESRTRPGKRLIMTNHHVVKNVAPGEALVVGFARGDVPIKATVLSSNPKLDVAVLEPLGELPRYVKPLPLTTRQPKQLQKVSLLGHPMGGLRPNYRNGLAPHALGGKVTQALPGGLTYTDAHSTSGTSGDGRSPRTSRRAARCRHLDQQQRRDPLLRLRAHAPAGRVAAGPGARTGNASPGGLRHRGAAGQHGLALRADAVWVKTVNNSSAAAAAGLRAGDAITGLTPPNARRSIRATPAVVDSSLKTLHTGGQLRLQVHRPGKNGAPSSRLQLQIGY